MAVLCSAHRYHWCDPTSDVLGRFDHPLQKLPVLAHAGTMLVCDVSSQDAFYCSSGTCMQTSYIFFSQKVQTCLTFLYKGRKVLHQWQVFCDDDFQETKTVHLLHFSSSNKDRGVFSTPFLLKSTRRFPIYPFTYKYIRLHPLCSLLISITVKYHKTILSAKPLFV